MKDGSKHKIKISLASFLNDVCQKEFIKVNSYYRQAIRKLASNFKITAMSDDGIIEAIEDGNIIGVQYYPEK